jgi:glycosyltransferase involved in cell wall biosynthesis
MKKSKVVIVMPAYNAAKTIEKTYRDVPEILKIKKNIILVDDASKDETAKIAQKLGLNVVIHKKNLGYGGNQKTCYKEALMLKPDIIVMIHPDYQYDATMTEELIRPIVDGWLDIMLGNRIRTRTEALNGGMPAYKYFSNRILTFIENIVLGQNLPEYHTGFRAFKAEVLKKLPLTKFSDDFVFDQEILISAIYSGYKIGTIPVPVRYFKEASSINLQHSIKYGVQTLITLMKYLLQKSNLYKFDIFK